MNVIHTQQSNDNKRRINILEYWQIIVAAAVVIGMFVTLQNGQANANTRIDKLEGVQLTTAAVNTQILVQLGTLQNDVSWIKGKFK